MNSLVTGAGYYDRSLENPVGLFHHIGRFGEALAVVDEQGRSWSYAAFTAFADAACADLPRHKCLVAVEVGNDLRSLAAYVGALRAGHAVMLLKDGTSSQDQAFLARFAPDFLCATSTDGWAPGAPGNPPVAFHPELAVLLTTSGSSGDPKLVRLSHDNLSSNAVAIAAYLAFAPGERAITTLPFHYSYGMSVVNSHLATGGALILNDASVHEPAFWDRFRQFGATSFAGVPHTFSLLERSGFTAQPPPPSLRYYTQAGGKLPGDAVVLFSHYAKDHDCRFYVMYGQTEAAPRIAYVPPEVIGQNPDAIGIAIPGGTITLLDDAGLPIEADGVTGELVYSGPNVMMGYGLCRGDLGRGHEHRELRTGDLAMRGEGGLYTIKGRMSRFVKIFGLRIGLDNIELQLRMAGFEAAATGSDDHLQIGVIGSGVSADVTRCILHHHRLTAASIEVLEIMEMPRLASGKVDYAGLRRMFEARADPALSAAGTLSLREAFAELLGQPSITEADSFSSAGGDSLTFINASLLLEDRLGFAPDGWERIPIRDLE